MKLIFKFNFKENYFLKFFVIFQFIINLFVLLKGVKINISDDYENKEKLEDIDTNILISIQNRLKKFIELGLDEQKFLNGIIRKYKPKKIVEIGVSAGGSSSLILNAIKDIPNAKLYSIDRNKEYYRNTTKKVGWLVKENFPELMNKWTLYTGKNPAEYIEFIGNKIDLAFIDTVHFTPGEMLNWLEVLPFLKEEAIVIFHDAFYMFATYFKNIRNFSNNQLLCYIRGKLILPSYGDRIFSRNIAAVKLDKNQKQYYKQYFLALGNQWQVFPTDNDLAILRKYFKKMYGENLVKIFIDAIEQNKDRFKYNIKKSKKL